jgi:hypothetical protein
MTKKQETEQETARALEYLRELLPPGAKVQTVLRHVSRSGMSRSISCLVAKDDQIHAIDWAVARVTGYKFDRNNGGLKVGGCGMDMGFALVYNLSSALYRDGFGCIGRSDDGRVRCPSNDHSNGDKAGYSPHGGDVTHWHTSGGYAIRHEWI